MQYVPMPALHGQSRTPRWCRLALISLVALGSLLVLPASSSASISTGDGGWVWQSPLPIGNQLNGVAFATTQIGWAVSIGGVILHTSDGGFTWMPQSSGTTSDLKAVTCASTAAAWAVGMSGTVVHTTDGGASWSVQSAGTGANLNAVACDGTTNAWAVGSGGVITHTSDGDTWTTQTSNTGATLRGVACHGALDAWAVGGSGVIQRTSDGGSTWSPQTPQTPSIVFEAVACSDSSNAWAVGDAGAVERTTDGGVAWTDEASGAASSNLMGVAAASASRVWAVGTSGVALSSTDGGQDWLAQTSGTTNHLTAVACSGITHAWAVGAFGTVIMSTDGATWTSGSSGVANGLYAVALLGGVPLAVGGNGVTRWDPVSQQWLSVASTTAYGLGALATSGTSDACAVGGTGTILVTTDGGATWTNKHMYQVNANLNGVSYGAKYIVAVGQSEQTCLSGDGGQSWFPEGTGYIGDLYAVTTYSLGTTDYAVAVGPGGVIERSTTGGLTWGPPETPPVYKDLYGVTSVVTGTNVDLWAVGASGTILHSTDGQTWTAQTSHTTSSLKGVNAQGSTLFAVGDSGTIDYSSDGGSTWTPEHSGSSAWLSGAVVGPLDTAWVVGTYGTVGTILYTDTDGVGTPADTQPPSAVSPLSSSTHPDPATWYVSNTPAFSWNAASDPSPGSGLKDYVYLLDHSANTTIDITTASTHATGQTAVTLQSTADGIWYFHVCARDNAGNYGATATRTVRIDATAPVTTGDLSPAANAAGWNSGPTTLTLHVDDGAGSGVPPSGTSYRLSGSPAWTPYMLPILLGTEGVTNYEFYSVDAVGNVETAKSVTVRIDTTAPAGSFILNGGAATTTTTSVTGGSSVSDANGVSSMRFSTDGKATWSSWASYSASAALTLPAGNGSKTVWAQYEDPAGNVFESSAAITLAVPTPAPTITLKLSGLKSGAVKLGKSVSAGGLVTPTSLAGSKVTLTVQLKKGAKWVKARTFSAAIASTGAYSWKFKPAKKGAYRVQATIAKTATHAAVTTKWLAFKVR
jgi:photosystem II stability/assembly factor-like uncharacterized protein